MGSTLIRVAGALLIADGIGSILLSTDQRPAANLFRVARAATGTVLILTAGDTIPPMTGVPR